MLQSLCEERIDKLSGHFFVVISLALFCLGLLQSHFSIGRDIMIEKHLYTICFPHKRDLITLPDGRINEDVVVLFLNAVWDRIEWNLYCIEARGFGHNSEFIA